MGNCAVAAVLDAVIVVVPEIPAALVAQRIGGTKTEQAVVCGWIVCLVTRKILTFNVCEELEMLNIIVRFFFFHPFHLFERDVLLLFPDLSGWVPFRWFFLNFMNSMPQ